MNCQTHIPYRSHFRPEKHKLRLLGMSVRRIHATNQWVDPIFAATFGAALAALLFAFL
jgi:hypothetical protein